MNFGENLRKLRRAKNLTQKEVGVIVDKTNTTIYDWESGKAYPNIIELGQLADYFNVTTDFLLGRLKAYQPIDNLNEDVEAKKDEIEAVTLIKKYTKDNLEFVMKLLSLIESDKSEDNILYQIFKSVGYRIDTKK